MKPASPVVMYSEKDFAAVEDHIERHFGPSKNVFHEILSLDAIHVDIEIVEPSPERNYYTLTTLGMGARAMNTPPELAEYKLERAELLICLPPDWKLEGPDTGDENWYWPLRWLKIMARLPFEHNIWLGWGHTIPVGGPVSPNAPFTCMLLTQPLLALDDEAQVCPLEDGNEINFYQVIPLHEKEMQYKIKHDTKKLLKRLQKKFNPAELAVVNTLRPCA